MNVESAADSVRRKIWMAIDLKKQTPKATGREFLTAFAIVLVLTTLPFLTVTFFPFTDYAQHLCQTKLFYETFHQGSDIYRINWLGPNTLIYYPLFLLWHFFSPLTAGKIGLLLLMYAQIGIIFLICHQECRPLSQALLASILVFNSSLYWGFLPFLSGWPVFGLFWLWSIREHHTPLWYLAGFLLGGLLFLAHTLWLLAGVGWLMFLAVSEWRSSGWRGLDCALPILPIILVAARWFTGYFQQKSHGFSVVIDNTISFIYRMHPVYLVAYSSISIKSVVTPLISVLLVVYLAVLISNRTVMFHPRLLAAAGMAFVFQLFAPYYFLNTILFAQRWLPFALMLFLLALTSPRSGEKLFRVSAAVCMIIALIAQTQAWGIFERVEMSGFEECVSAIPQRQKIAWIDQKKKSKVLIFRAFVQMGAYLELLSGAETNFSFASHDNGIVSFLNLRSVPTQLLFPDNKEPDKADLKSFTYVILNGSEEQHQAFSKQFPFVEPITKQGFWRAYKT